MTRLDHLLEAEIKAAKLNRIQAIGRRLDPTLRAALRNRVRELTRMGLAREEKRDRFRFEPDWATRLETNRPGHRSSQAAWQGIGAWAGTPQAL